MAEPLPGLQAPEKTAEGWLDSWKEIAAYLDRDVRTVQRWEKREGMPVHRHLHDKLGSVYALAFELDAWRQNRKARLQEEPQETVSESPAASEDAPAVVPRVSRRRILGFGVALITLLTVAVIARIGVRNAGQLKIKSLAVLPLENLSGDPAQEYLANGMTEAVIGRLSTIHGLRVISRTSVMQFKNTRMSVPEIAKTLHVDAIVEGSVIQEGSRVRVHAQLIRAASDEHFWSETYDRDLGGALELQSQVAQAIAEKVQVTLTGEERARLVAARPVPPEVYESYLKGEFALTDRRADLEKSVAYFEEAIQKDATFAPAYLGLAEAYSSLSSVFVGARPDGVRSQQISAAHKAVELDPTLSQAHDLLANAYQEDWQWGDAEAEYNRALELNPNDAEAHSGYARWLLTQGRTDEAQAWIRRARELDPVGIGGVGVGWVLFQSRHYEEAIRELRTSVALQPDNALAYWFLGFALSGNGQNEEAIPVLNKARSLSNDSPAVVGVLIRAYARAGHRVEALQLLEELKERQKHGYIPAAAFVNAYLGLGDSDQVFAWCERAYQEHSNILLWIKVHPFFDPVRGDPRFADLVRRVGVKPGP
jgi:pentatricopeptide repeat protein